mgnify:CR=1 FL=1
MKTDHFDILIIGAGISGIGIACRLSQRFPERRIAILERRAAAGGTWDLFRYPGIRSDSDMFSYAYDLRPWLKPEILASGGEILNYLDATIEEFGIRDMIRFGHRVEAADWNSEAAAWHVKAVDETCGEARDFSARFLVACTGYYDQDRGYMPDFPGADEFTGRIVHPQHWPDDLEYRDRNVIVIGSGATAATIVPAIAGTARHVTMLQRSPSYFFDVPAKDIVFATLRWLLPKRLAARAARLRSHHRLDDRHYPGNRQPGNPGSQQSKFSILDRDIHVRICRGNLHQQKNNDCPGIFVINDTPAPICPTHQMGHGDESHGV